MNGKAKITKKAKGAKGKRPEGVPPTLLLKQVKATAAWALLPEKAIPSAPILARAVEIERRWKEGEAEEEYFTLLLAAHFTTVATFSPTDVDVRIREHAFRDLAETCLMHALDRVEEVARWDVRGVSERTITFGDEVLAGHQGEWLSVMAGALGRALALGDRGAAERARTFIEAELAREEKLVTLARKKGTDADLLRTVTTVAHNLGDLSRVVDTWRPAQRDSELARRYQRLGHDDGERFKGAFVFAGELNKKLMALENHRFLPLRVPRALRRDRSLLLPFGPYFYDWGRTVGSTDLLTSADRAEVLVGLAKVHERRPEELGCLRAIAGMHSVLAGGIDALARDIPPEHVMTLRRAPVQNALRESEASFQKRFHEGVVR